MMLRGSSWADWVRWIDVVGTILRVIGSAIEQIADSSEWRRAERRRRRQKIE